MPVPRRFDRRPPERDTTRINERIRVPEVRVIDEEGQQVGVMKTPDALSLAQERDLDLVEVAPEARPPVTRILDYSKYKYEQAQKVKQARKHQQQITVREIKFRPKIAQHDYDTKKAHVERFLKHKDKVKITIMFRGREVTHPERGTMILDRLAEELQELGVVEQRPMQEGRNMTMMMAPSKAVLAGRLDGSAEDEAAAEGAPADGAPVDGAPADGAPADAASDGATVAGDGTPAAEPAGEADAAAPETSEPVAEESGETAAPDSAEPAAEASAETAAEPGGETAGEPSGKTASAA
ncbi:MAG TPA: translation initiation factor IF-3 [Solirubrobacteraceae bacterium]|nr:translation initiation factor IF-3 [Solirubrobacteraceae bacterium]